MKFIKICLYGEDQTIYININEVRLIKPILDRYIEVTLQSGKIYEVLYPPYAFEEHFDNFLKGDRHVPEHGWAAHTQEARLKKENKEEKKSSAEMWDLNP